MEQPRALLDKSNAHFLRGIEHRPVVLTARRRRDVFHAGACGAVHVVHEGELYFWKGKNQ